MRKTRSTESILLAGAAILSCGLAVAAHAQTTSQKAVPAFPGAEGFGALSKGGRGGRVMEVTNLNDSGPGSLRACLEAKGPRVCVFRVAGYIDLLLPIRVTDGRLTVAGQTAPGAGITVRRHESKLYECTKPAVFPLIQVGGYQGDYGIKEPVRDVIIRYLRVRQGGPTKAKGKAGAQADTGANIRSLGVINFILDHVSAGWANDNQIALGLSGARAQAIENVTFQRCLVHEPMVGHNTGIAIAGSGRDKTDPPKFKSLKHIDVHHNLLHSTGYRNPSMGTDSGRVINNVVYNWGSRLTATGGETRTDVIGNTWRAGPNGPGVMNTISGESAKTQKGWPPSIHHAGNVLDAAAGRTAAGWDAWKFQEAQPRQAPYLAVPPEVVAQVQRATPLPEAPFPITIQPAENAYASVIADVGMNRRLDAKGNWVWVQDAVDARLIEEVKTRTGFKGEKQSVADAGGWPELDPGTPYPDADHDGMSDEWEQMHFGNTQRGDPRDSSGDLDGDGYTDLEEFLNGTNPTAP
ncbi:MAG: hypothetical protein JXR37_00435 [Kiritimatiellae bacterium]|nr:hypothetical protein [Kiritimatiellia bacterium]